MKIFKIIIIINLHLYSCTTTNDELDEQCKYDFFEEEKNELIKQNDLNYKKFNLAIEKGMTSMDAPLHFWNINENENDNLVLIDTLLFNEDSSKVVGMITIKSRLTSSTSLNSICSSHSYKYSGRAFIGYKSNMNWKVYNFGSYVPVEMSSINMVKKRMHSYYLNTDSKGEFKKGVVKILIKPDTLNCMGKWGSVQVKYDIEEKDFWEKSVIWKKDLVIKDYYYFEVEPGAHIYCREPFLKPVIIKDVGKLGNGNVPSRKLSGGTFGEK
jgi:hypothetical protein